MFTNTIDKKPIINDKNNNIIRDLTKSIFNFSNVNFIGTSVYRVPKGYEMRSDLISQSTYNNTLYAEFILKYNSISNPFTIAPDDIILIPVLDDFKEHVNIVTFNNVNNLENRIRNKYKYIDPTKIPKIDSNISKFNNRNLAETVKTTETRKETLPPNITKTDDLGITHRNGRVYFGETIGESACLKNGMSSSEFLTKVIKRK